ncbi:MAG: cysteine desulfurase family protein [Patescibacteria group bacterium]|jgi:cysteine desulfurase|nr:cysteine desulfurase family protein [bacterium]HQC49506.1 cysteine desulfurase family protein [bacterium]
MQVYLDNAATTALDQRVLKKMLPFFSKNYGNASSIHNLGQEAFDVLQKAKKNVAYLLGGDENGVIFTSGATEANNFIIKGVALANRSKKKNKIIISAIEHPCVRESAKQLARAGFIVEILPVNKDGLVNPNNLRKIIDKRTILVSVMAVNNEVGTIQEIEKLAKITHQFGAYFHTDAAQAVPIIKFNVKKMGIDFLSLSAHKFYGPKGVGVAYLNRQIKIKPLITGGGQEDGLRSGTYNLPGIVGLSEALALAYQERNTYLKKIKSLSTYFWEKVKKEIPEVKLNGSAIKRAPNNINLMFSFVEGEAILIDLSQKGIYVSTGSACSAADLRASYVLKAMGQDKHFLNSNIRFSFGRFNTKKEIDYTIKELKNTVNRLRSFSPFIK